MSLHELHTQMEAIQQMENTRASEGRGTPTINRDSLLAMSQPRNFSQNGQQRFLSSLHNIMLKKGTPLPQALTGIPGTEPSPRWNILQPGAELGSFHLAGKDINLHKLWGIVTQSGGHATVTAQGAWPAILPHFDLPAQSPELLPTGTHSVPETLARYYFLLLAPIEELWQQNVQLQRQRVLQAGQQPPFPQPSAAPAPSFLPQPTPSSDASLSQLANPSNTQTLKPEVFPLESDSPDSASAAVKRKSDSEDETKRTRQKIEPSETVMPSSSSRNGSVTSSKSQPSRRKIEYVPLAREVDTYGGHDLNDIESQFANAHRRALRDMSDYGVVDIEALTLSLRSRLSVELSYTLTMLTMLSSILRPQNDPFRIVDAPDLLAELLDCLEAMAFSGDDDFFNHSLDQPIATNRDMIDQVLDAENRSFAPLQTSTVPMHSTMRKAHYILAITNIIRNLSTVPANGHSFVQNGQVIPILLRICGVTRGSDNQLQPASSALSLSDLIAVRRDVIYTLSNLTSYMVLSPEDSENPREVWTVKRSFNLIASYLVSPTDAVSPLGIVHFLGTPLSLTTRPPPLAEVALETLTRLGHLDSNRQVIAKCIPDAWLWTLLESLTHRLPVTEVDFTLLRGEHWLSHMEKILLALYTIAFLASPSFKTRVKKDRRLSIFSVLLRMVHKFTQTADVRQRYALASRRAIETMKMLDDATDSFDSSKSVAPTLSFGMGYGEGAEAAMETGTGLLGSRRELAFEFMMQPEVFGDPVTFKELESLARVDV